MRKKYDENKWPCRQPARTKAYNANYRARMTKAEYEAFAERRRIYSRKYRAANIEECRTRSNRWHAANRPRINARERARRKADPEKYSARRKRHYRANGDKMRHELRLRYHAAKGPDYIQLLDAVKAIEAMLQPNKRKNKRNA